MSLYVGVDLGGTNIVSGLADEKGRILARDKRPTRQDLGFEGSLEQMRASIRAVMEGATESVRAIGIGSPGPIDPFEGVVLEPENLPAWRNVPLVRLMEEAFGVPVFLDNDANVAALGEQWQGAGKGIRFFLCVTLGTGIGGGVVLDGKLLQGFNGNAAEIGHITIDYNGPQCPCGNRGCLELYASATGIVRRTKEKMERERPDTVLWKRFDGLTAKDISEAANDGDEFARAMYEETGFLLGVGLVSAVNLYNVEVIALGGGMAQAGEILFEPVRRTVRERGLPGVRDKVRIVPSELGDDAGLLGAARMAMQRTE
ncbi:MAG: ROK family protein [Candidatus Latescibacterota bacterium]|nr:MAG: ROK family protein [Candidatus Latescibacterota bacterium]